MRPMGLMGLMGPIGLMSLIGLISLMGLVGCSDDEEATGNGVSQTLTVVPCAQSFAEVNDGEDAALTRAWTPPSPYVLYESLNGLFSSQKNLTNNSIGVFFTKNATDPLQATFFHYKVGDNDRWRVSLDELKEDDYFVYGFIPSEVVTTASITGNSSYSDGAVLTLNGIKTVTPNDVCVVVGAKKGSGPENDDTGTLESPERIQPGQFAVTTVASTKDSPVSGTGNNIFLLFDHLYSAIRFNFTVGEKYDALRTIRLRKLEMIAYTDDSKTKIKAKYNATVRIKANTTGTLPITEVTFTPDTGSGDAVFEPLFNGEATLSHSTPSSFMGCFVPGQTTRFTLRSTYDVYDKNTDHNDKGNLIRKECTAENYINLPSLFTVTSLARGHIYTINLIVQPTYLNVLSEPDVEDPEGVELIEN